MNIYEAFIETYKNKELVSEFNRLRGTNIGHKTKKLTPIEMAVDSATGNFDLGEDKKEMELFMDFFINCIWLRILREHNSENKCS